jgi:hypothetical protein
MRTRYQTICEKCHRVFANDSSSGTICSPCVDAVRRQQDCIANATCSICNERFYTPNNISRCPFCTHKRYSFASRDPKKYDPKKEYKKPVRNKVSLDELIRRQEWKRVMDEDGWDHYLRGRKWDKI